tara:strand:- start:686 stop:1012 length:327 start_codon:yes stop_codon:yes gene_type:complete
MSRLLLLFCVALINAMTVNDVADNIIAQLGAGAELIAVTSFAAGLGFLMATFYKFKQHKDNPTQVPVGNPLTMLSIAVLLIYLGNLIQPIGETIFGAPSVTAASILSE